jgi:hypothetical protein
VFVGLHGLRDGEKMAPRRGHRRMPRRGFDRMQCANGRPNGAEDLWGLEFYEGARWRF